MTTKIYKLFGFKIFEIVCYGKDEAPLPKFSKKPQGSILSYTPLEAERDKDKSIIDRMKGRIK